MYDIKDSRGVPVSSGIPRLVLAAFFIGVVLIFIVGGMVISVSRFGHVWPSMDSTRIRL